MPSPCSTRPPRGLTSCALEHAQALHNELTAPAGCICSFPAVADLIYVHAYRQSFPPTNQTTFSLVCLRCCFHACFAIAADTDTDANTTRIIEEEQGIIPRVITGMYDLLREAKEERPNVSYSVRCQFLEIYGEDIHDLLEPAGSTVTIREGQNGEVNVHGAKEMLVNGAEVRKKKGRNHRIFQEGAFFFFSFWTGQLPTHGSPELASSNVENRKASPVPQQV